MIDQLIVRKAIRGNKDAFAFIIQQNKEELYKIAYLYTKNEDDAFEAISETVYKSFISIKNLKNPEYIKTWLIRILINECIGLLKKKNKIVLEGDDSKFDVPCENEYDLNLQYEDLYEAINDLNDKQRTAIVLKYFQDFKLSEIAQVMNVPMNTVKSHIRRGVSSLKISLKEDFNYGE